MKIILEPTVYLIGKQQLQKDELDRFLNDNGVTWESDSEVASEVISETAGRVCYMSFAKPRPGGNEAYLKHIKEVGHGSVLENTSWTFLFTGVSRTLTHELVRHRAGWAYSMLSQRYVDESVAEYVCPPDLQKEFKKYEPSLSYPIDWDDDVVAGQIWYEAMENAHSAYIKLADHLTKKAEASGLIKTEARKFARQAARSVLPNATETKITCTANARALRHFLEMRGSRHAEPEIRILASSVLDVLSKDAPNLFGDYRKVPLPDGTFELDTDYRKV